MVDTPDYEAMRIGTAEREQAMQSLQAHFADGRLDVHEYDDRVAKVVAGRTRGDLREVFGDLPPPYPAFLNPPAPAPMAPYPQQVVYPQPGGAVPGGAMPGGAIQPYSDKSRLTAGLLQILLPFGIGRFYTGHTGIAVGQLLTSIIAVGVIWSFIDGIILLVNGGTDKYGRPMRD
ncbi:TM2 domain-containing protein [Tamaricihabitans halophyticus]|uniref:TM2 domain-containing protein n=1 Tax=Tamaricihabitans halophyticus TaxID=1262583 RepID=A0A4R2PY76_9PSEU|nr:DUF1707 domain-containing protein [Tamaricihabitans halophyticus]TCP39215.1 TM2 domain-containing protein [Tamaricihabitans halophyticus]